MPIHVRSFRFSQIPHANKLAHDHSHLADFDPPGGSSTVASVGRNFTLLGESLPAFRHRSQMNKLHVASVAYCEIHVVHVFYRGPAVRKLLHIYIESRVPGLIT